MSSSLPAPSTPALRYEMRPSPLKAWNENAPDEVVPVGENAPGLGDFLQALNPLQHLPVIGTAYRALTGATIEPAARIVGGLIFGGPLGMLGSLVNAFVEEDSGADVGEHFLAMVGAGKQTGVEPPPAPPSGAPTADDGAAMLQFASFAADGRGSIERDGLLTTWIAAGAPTAPQLAAASAAMPSHAGSAGGIPVRLAAMRPEALASTPVIAPPQTVATEAPQPSEPVPAAQAEGVRPNGKGKSLEDYRTGAVAPVGFRAAAATAVDNFGLARRAEGARKLATQTQAAMLPASLQVQDVAQAGEAAPQNYFSAAMVAGLERYRDMQRRRDAAAPADGI
jgi:hypothetical protein